MQIFKRSAWKSLTITLISCCLFVGALTLSLPSLLSTSWGNEALLKIVNSYITENLQVQKISLSWFGSQKVEGLSVEDPLNHQTLSVQSLKMETSLFTFITNRELSGKLALKKISFKTLNDESTIDTFYIFLKKHNGFQNIAIQFDGKISSTKAKEGSFSGELEMHSFSSLHTMTIALKAKTHNFPAAFLEILSGRNEIGALFGHSIEMDIALDTNKHTGNIQASLSGKNGQTSLHAHMENNVLTLNDPFILKTKGTTELHQKILNKISPLFKEMIASEEAIHLKVSPEHFSLPIRDFSLDKLHVEHATLDAGMLVFKNNGEIKELFSALRPVESEKINIWTTPLHISLKNGILNIQRMDMLIMDKYPIAAWGKINFIKDKVQVTLGLTGIALSRVLDNQNIGKDVIVQIPVTGSLTHAKIDKSKATRKIGALIAQNSNHPGGLILGAALGLMNGKEEAVPPQTTNPLPWEKSRKKN